MNSEHGQREVKAKIRQLLSLALQDIECSDYTQCVKNVNDAQTVLKNHGVD